MRALILCDATLNTGPAQLNVRVAANACYSVGIKVEYLGVTTTSPSVASLNSAAFGDIDLVIIPSLTSAVLATYSRFYDGTVEKPVFVLSKNTINSTFKGVVTNSYADSGVHWYSTTVTATGSPIVVVSRRAILVAQTGPAESIALMDGGDVGTTSGGNAIAAWRYTPDGVNYVFYSATDFGSDGMRFNPFHLFLQNAVDLGLILAPPKKAPCFIVLDHVNDAGEPTAAGGQGGWQENYRPLATLGSYLRSKNAVALASIERVWEDGGQGTTTGDLLATLQEYQDVFKVCPYHDHEFPHNTAAADSQSPIDSARSKTDMAGSNGISGTVTSITNLGLTPDYTFGHFSLDRSNDNLWQLATPRTTKMASTDNLTIQAGYGMLAARISASTESWPANVRGGDGTQAPPWHWMEKPIAHRGITFITGLDTGATSMAPNFIPARDIYGLQKGITTNLISGTMAYLHAEDFEDVAWRTANLAGNPTTSSGGVLTTTYGQAAIENLGGYCDSCPDTTKFGAHPAEYL